MGLSRLVETGTAIAKGFTNICENRSGHTVGTRQHLVAIVKGEVVEPASQTHPAMPVLEYIKVLVWPLLLLVGVLMFRPQVVDILNTRELSIGSLTVGKKIEGIGNSMQQQLAVQKRYIEEIDAHADNPTLVRENARWLLGVIPTVQKNVGQDIVALQQEIQTAKAPSTGASPASREFPKTARDWEQKGFEALLAKDVDAAIGAFSQAEGISPTYHNVAEIHRLLADRRDVLKTKDADWKPVYKPIVARYSWGMPAEVLSRLKDEL